MDPPAYTSEPPPPAPVPTRTILDLRELILLNGSMLFILAGSVGDAEVILCQIPPNTNIAEEIEHAGKHYAVLIKSPKSKMSSSISKINVIMKSEPRETPELALEYILDKTEQMMHEVIMKGRNYEGKHYAVPMPVNSFDPNIEKWLQKNCWGGERASLPGFVPPIVRR